MMLHQDSGVVDRLRLALSDGTIPSQRREMGAQLLSNLQNAVHVTFVGLPQCGKSSLINMMLGRAALRPIPDVEVLEVVYGPDLKTTFLHADGQTSQHDGLVTDRNVVRGAIHAQVALPDEILRQQTFTEFRLSGPIERQQELLQHAVEVGQITVWCSETFSETEQALWRTVPDAIKDHSFLALTMADRQMMKGSLAQRIEDLGPIVSEEFLGLYPVATLQAIAARADGVAPRQDMWSSSGGRPLFEAIASQVRLGRAEELDRAAVLLAQYPATSPAPAVPLDVSGDKVDDRPGSRDESRTVSDQPASVNPSKGETGDGAVELARTRLQRCADDMAKSLSGTGSKESDKVFDLCVEAVRDLSDLFATDGHLPGDVSDLLEDIRDGEEMLLLLQIEKGEAAAEDAVSLMLQLKKEISERGGAR